MDDGITVITSTGQTLYTISEDGSTPNFTNLENRYNRTTKDVDSFKISLHYFILIQRTKGSARHAFGITPFGMAPFLGPR